MFASLIVTTALNAHAGDVTTHAAKVTGTGMSALTSATRMVTDETTKATEILIFCFYLSYDIAYTPLLVSYAVEILPFNIRAKGFALMVSPAYLWQFGLQV